MSFPKATNDDPLTCFDKDLPFQSRLPGVAHYDFGRFRNLLHATNVAYNSFKIHHHERQSFRGSKGEYDKVWDQWRARILRESQIIKIERPALYAKWGAEGTPRLWDSLEGLADWWDDIHKLVNNRISEISNMERPELPDWQESQGRAEGPSTKGPSALADTRATNEANPEPAEQAQQPKAASPSTQKTTPDNEQRPLRRLNRQAHAKIRQQIQSQIRPSTSRTEQRKAVTGPTQMTGHQTEARATSPSKQIVRSEKT